MNFLGSRQSRVMRQPRLGNLLGETDFKALEPHLRILDKANIHAETRNIQQNINDINTRSRTLDRCT